MYSDLAGNAESAPRWTNPRTGKRQLSTEKEGNKFGCAIFLGNNFGCAKRTHRRDASIPTLLCSEAHRPIALYPRKSCTLNPKFCILNP